MKRTSNNGKSWKEDMVWHWERAVVLYQKGKDSPSLKFGGKILSNIFRILFSILLKKAVEFFISKF